MGADRAPSEGVHEAARESHRLEPADWLARFEREDDVVPNALRRARYAIIELGHRMASVLASGGRILYFGAGTSGRIGVLDAAEWEPTYGLPRDRIVARIAGGSAAFERAIEGAEDDVDAADRDFDGIAPTAADLIVGISASGSARYVRRVIERARAIPASRVWLTSNPKSAEVFADPRLLVVELETGAELLAGSTRLKAATATHQALQRAGNLCALELGWLYAGRMVEMRPTNRKLVRRAIGIVAELGSVSRERAEALLVEAENDIKVALVCARCGVGIDVARCQLARVDRRLTAIEGF